jgi:hypothetical protein
MKSYFININHANKLIHFQHSGKIKPKDIGRAWEEFLKLEEFTVNKYNLLSDYRNSKFVGKQEDVEHICGILENLRSILYKKKQAFLLYSPINTALSLLFEGEINKRIGFIVKVFSTEEAALKWLTK